MKQALLASSIVHGDAILPSRFAGPYQDGEQDCQNAGGD
jgi:hypothetical protein